MHEVSMANAIVETVINSAKKNNANKILEVKIEVGELTLLNPEQLKFCLETLSKDTILENTKFKIQKNPARISCNCCGYEGKVKIDDNSDHYLAFVSCPKCGCMDIKILSGRECNVKSIKIEKGD
ncbi:hydrogenase nickel insertion protein HypA [Methanothermus fervidus DSM 2088]|uniref:Hydrogenase maturation factor HypA n=1 Tax=Methanothermus fervidus (strain ATCC 43054 / DSM 2088 / JCM 10308 / V24 S) TaxID=523846 RepID=E3GY21_METFV|nr:hydrogenase maturation nickel metallochaperone HypA [Methanothermus fervidus]ADP77203.1 hydrogenase nickel insertion protein HypA [Methanothermus fervidus DSM 2088]